MKIHSVNCLNCNHFIPISDSEYGECSNKKNVTSDVAQGLLPVIFENNKPVLKQGQDIRIFVGKYFGCKHFGNKIYN